MSSVRFIWLFMILGSTMLFAQVNPTPGAILERPGALPWRLKDNRDQKDAAMRFGQRGTTRFEPTVPRPGSKKPGLSFATAVVYDSGGSGADSVAVADVNGDGKPDLLVANEGNGSTGSVSVLLGNGDGTFQPAVTYGSGAKVAASVAVADVNGDGKPDLLVANGGNGTGSVGVLLGNGDGTFQKAVNYGTGVADGSSWVAVADVNGDGKPDPAGSELLQPRGLYRLGRRVAGQRRRNLPDGSDLRPGDAHPFCGSGGCKR